MKRSIEKLFCDVQTGELVDTTTGDASRRENYPIKWEMQMCALNNLLSYRRTLDLSVEFYELSEQSDIKGNLRDQLLRAASSISLNLAEGNAKRTVAEKKRYYHTAYASCQECKTVLRLAKIQDSKINQVVDHLGASLFKLLKAEIRSIQDSVYG